MFPQLCSSSINRDSPRHFHYTKIVLKYIQKLTILYLNMGRDNDMELKEIIASRIKELRVINNLSQVQIAKELGTTQASVARYERGEIFPKEIHVLWYADRFNVSLDWIYGRTNQRKGGMLKKNLQKHMSEDMKKIIGDSLGPGEDVYEMIKERVEEMAKQMVENSKKK